MTAIIILGGHRCGTSCVAGAIAHLGVPASLPGDAIGASPSNPRGHFEDRTLVRLHERMLGRGRWCDPTIAAPLCPRLIAQYDAHLKRRAAAGLWSIKDPRLCVLLPVLLDRLRGLSVAAVVVSVKREVAAAADSLQRRQRMQDATAQRIAALYEGARRAQLGWLASQPGVPVLELDYPDVLADRRATVTRLAGFLGVPLTDDAVEFLDPGLRHC